MSRFPFFSQIFLRSFFILDDLIDPLNEFEDSRVNSGAATFHSAAHNSRQNHVSRHVGNQTWPAIGAAAIFAGVRVTGAEVRVGEFGGALDGFFTFIFAYYG